MRHSGTKRLETPRLLLRPFAIEDVEPAFANWVNDPRVTRYLQWAPHGSPEVTRAVFGAWIASYGDPAFYQWAIVPKDLGQPIGSIGVVYRDDATDMLHIGYCIGAPWWHGGYTSEALRAVVDYLFEVVGANRIESQHDPRNVNSGRVMEKCGLRFEGVLRQAFRSHCGLADKCTHSLLRSEWEAMRAVEDRRTRIPAVH